MDKKYVVMRHVDGEEHIFVFPPSVDHDRFAEATGAIRFGAEQQWRRHMYGFRPVSAGFVDHGGQCYGRSETLGLESRGDADTRLLDLDWVAPAGATKKREAAEGPTVVRLADGKYEFRIDERGLMTEALRHGERWQAGLEMGGSKVFLEALSRIVDLEAKQ